MKKLLLLIKLLILLSTTTFSQGKWAKFRHFGVDDGMTQNSGRFIMQDSKGFVWIATEIGLNRYDGYTFRKFLNHPYDTNTLSNNFLNVLLESSDGKIWIGTDGSGLNYYDPLKEKIFRIQLDSNMANRSQYIYSLCEDKNNNIWAGTANGIFVFNPKNKEITHYLFQRKPDKHHLSYPVIHHLLCDSTGDIWIASGKTGIDRFVKKEGAFKHYRYNINKQKSIASDFVNSFNIDKNGNLWVLYLDGSLSKYDYSTDSFTNFDLKYFFNTTDKNFEFTCFLPIDESNIWIGTDETGLWHYNPSKTTVAKYINDPNFLASISSNEISSIMLDKTNNLWVGTNYDGINILDNQAKPFHHFSSHNVHKNLKSVGSIILDHKGYFWIGTMKGVFQYHPQKDIAKLHKAIKNNPSTITDNFISSLYVDTDNLVWIGSDAGLTVFDHKTNKFLRFNDLLNKKRLRTISVWGLIEDFENNIWIGTWSEGILKYNKKDQSLKHYLFTPEDSSSISSNNIIYFFEDSEKTLWIGTWEGGLCKYNRNEDNFTTYKNNPKDSTSISHNIVITINEDNEGNLWLGTFGGGLNKFDKKSENFSCFTKDDGLTDNAIMEILKDDHNNFWISTSNGISKLDINSKKFTNFHVSDGLQSNEFSQHGAHKCNDGRMIFSGINGFNLFHPDSIKLNPYLAEIQITNFKIFNKDFKEYDSLLLEYPIEFTDKIKMTWRESVFSFGFAAIHYSLPEKNQYAYRMEGFEQEWNYVGNKRTATYTNLDPGEYTFQVKATNNDGIWNENPKEIRIIITPPFWRTNAFYISVTLFLLLVAYLIMRYREYKLKRDKKNLEKKVYDRTEEIRKQNNLILEQNEELKQQKEEILTQRDQIEGQNKHLAGLNKELTEQKEEIETQRDEIQMQRDEIQKQNLNIKASIRYALRIQQSILPDKRTIKKLLPESFILYLPKDIVSGDFYWLTEKSGKILFSAIDCTGHGVPGAFMSIVGYNLLKRAVNELGITKPAEVLNFLSQGINLQLRQRQEEGSVVKDGMDLALCAYDPKTATLEFAGVNNPLYLLRNNEITRFKGQRQDIGDAFTEKFLSYENNEIKIKEGDIIYIFSDGYVDQFGGPNRKKFMSKQFKNVLLENHKLSMQEQKQNLYNSFIDWKGQNTQIDDVLVMGVKF